MGIDEHLKEFAGLPVREYVPGEPLPEDAGKYAWRIKIVWVEKQVGPARGCLGQFIFSGGTTRTYEPIEHTVEKFISDPQCGAVHAMLFGLWGIESEDPQSAVNVLIQNCEHLLSLRAAFFGEIISEECEISWFTQGNYEKLWSAFPKLEVACFRGSGMRLGEHFEHTTLKTFVIESGGLEREVVAQILDAKLPNLEHLEIWFGSYDYGATCELDDLQPLFDRNPFPNLKYLGLRNAEFADEVAVALAKSTCFPKLEVLDLSLGSLSDNGAIALLNSPVVQRLKKLDVHHHYLSRELVKKIEQLPIETNTADAQGKAKPENRYVAVGE